MPAFEVILPKFGVDDMKGLLTPFKPLFDERTKHSVLLVEAIEKSANVRLFAKNAISYVDGTFMELHDGPPSKLTSPGLIVRHIS
jgi:hypothetical protein